MTTIEREGVRICGCTLWSAIPPPSDPNYHLIQKYLADYNEITFTPPSSEGVNHKFPGNNQPPKERKLEPSDTHQFHTQQINWLNDQIQIAKQQNQPLIVLSHHAPSLLCSDVRPSFKHHPQPYQMIIVNTINNNEDDV